MTTTKTGSLLAALGAVALVWLFLAALPATAAEVTYQIDPEHSSLHFKVRHLGVSNVWGRFTQFSGTIRFDEQSPEESVVKIEVSTDSVDTDNERRDTHLRSPDFFNVKQFPVLTFESTAVEPLSEDLFRVSGKATLNGVTNPVTADVRLIGSGKHPRSGKPLIGFESSFAIDRSDFGMNFMVGPLGDTVTLNLAIEAGIQ